MQTKPVTALYSTILVLLMVLPTLATATTTPPTPPQPTPQGTYDLLIVTPRQFRLTLQPLVAHKNKIGIRTILVTTDTVYQQTYWQGRDQAEQLKYYIKNAIEAWGIHYVLLIGGRKNQGPTEQWWIPVRYSHLDRPYETYPETKFLTDLYFADIYNTNGTFSSWDDNQNGIFAEWPVNSTALDRPNLTPDISLGRIPCTNTNELRIIIRKIIQYENKPKQNTSWFNTMIVAAGDTYPGRTPYYDGEIYTQQGLNLMTGFTPVQLYTSTGTLKNGRDIVRAINKGAGFVWLSGHGNPKVWGTHPPNDNNTWINLRMRQLVSLHNHKKLPVLITGSGCFNSMFNVSLRSHSPWVFGIPVGYCISYAFMVQPDGGSIATIGSTAFSYESPDISLGYGGIEWLDRQFFAEYAVNHTTILGDTWAAAVTSVINHCPIDYNDASSNGAALVAKNIQQWILFGDPSLQIGG
jgi:hypothetical protein